MKLIISGGAVVPPGQSAAIAIENPKQAKGHVSD